MKTSLTSLNSYLLASIERIVQPQFVKYYQDNMLVSLMPQLKLLCPGSCEAKVILRPMDQANGNFMNASIQLIFDQVPTTWKADALSVTKTTKMTRLEQISCTV